VRLPDILKHQKKCPLKTIVAYDNFHEETFEGVLEIINNQVDPNTGMINLRSVFENSCRDLWPGQFVRTRLILRVEKDVLAIPFTCVQLTTAGPVAFVVKDDGTVEKRNLELGERQDDTILVKNGLQAGERVVMEGQLNLSDGVSVRIHQ
jgi:multidrug efflux system membrane fusion protein